MSGINIDNAAEREHESYFYRFTRILINSSESIPIHPLSRAEWTWTKIGLLKSPPLSQLKWSEISRYNNFFFNWTMVKLLMIMAGFGQLYLVSSRGWKFSVVQLVPSLDRTDKDTTVYNYFFTFPLSLGLPFSITF